MHMRFSVIPRDPDTNVALPTGRPARDYSTKWDRPLGDLMGSETDDVGVVRRAD